MSNVRASVLANTSGDSIINLDSLSTTGYYTKQIVTQIDTTARTATTTWVLGPTFDNIACSGNSLLLVDYYVPMRNESTSWGGGYIEPQVSFDGGTSWNSLGSCGYDGGVMRSGNASISYYYQQLLINPGLTSSFTARFRFYFKSYDSTVGWNNGVNHNINANLSGAAPLPYTNNGNQHWMHIIVEELARYA